MSDSQDTITMESRLVANPGLVLRVESDDNAILFDPDSGSVRVLNVSAAAVWRLADGRRTLGDIVGALADQFEGMQEGAPDQVLAVARHLYRLGALQQAGGAE